MDTIYHSLVDASTSKVFNITVAGTNVTTESGTPGKTRVTEKVFSDKGEALKFFYKKEWEMLKKGFVLYNEDAKAGQPVLHCFIGAGYTGSLSFDATPKGIYVYKHGSYDSADSQEDYIVLIDTHGNVKETILLPKILPWDIQYDAPTDKLLLDLDHSIYTYDLQSSVFTELANNESWTSFIAVGATKNAYAANETVYIADKENNIVSNWKYDTVTIMGTTPFSAQLSENGAMLALHTKESEIEVFNTVTAEIILTITGDFPMVDQMEFVSNDELLVVRETHGKWGMRYFEIPTGKEVTFPSLEVPEYTKDVNKFCFNSDKTMLAIIQRTTAYIYDFTNKKLLHSFPIDHSVKTVQPKFVGNMLGFRTDYGCFSLYNV
jgi:hypothetical protein